MPATKTKERQSHSTTKERLTKIFLESLSSAAEIGFVAVAAVVLLLLLALLDVSATSH